MKQMLLLLLVIIAGCTSTGNNAKFEKDLYTGVKGVQMTFYDTPKTLLEEEDLSYNVKIENKGPYPVNNAIFLVSVEKGYMQFHGGDNVFTESISLKGKTVYNLFDDFKLISIPIKVQKLDPQSEKHDSVILAMLCYDYHGSAFTDVCIDTDPYSTSPDKKVCSIKSSISLGGQGGPVAISKIETRMFIENDMIRPQFKLYLSNQGKGNVISPGSVSKVCSKNAFGQEIYNTVRLNEVEISGRKLSSGDMECFPTEIALRENEDFITCTVKSSKGISRNTASYLTPLKIDIDYGYAESSSKEISINKILKY